MKFENLFTFGPNKTRGKCMHDTMFIPLACNFDSGRAISLAWYCFKSVLNFSIQFRRSLLHNFNIHVIPFHVMLKKSSACYTYPLNWIKKRFLKLRKSCLFPPQKYKWSHSIIHSKKQFTTLHIVLLWCYIVNENLKANFINHLQYFVGRFCSVFKHSVTKISRVSVFFFILQIKPRFGINFFNLNILSA